MSAFWNVLRTSSLVHFLALGGVIFGLAPKPARTTDIHISKDQLEALEALESRRSGNVDDSARRSNVLQRTIEDELLVREAIRLGLDRDDGIVRQRLVQKMLFLAEDLGGVSRDATESELRAYHNATRAQWSAPAAVDLEHIFLAPGNTTDIGALRKLADASLEHPPPLGDAFPAPRVVHASPEELERSYGADFARAAVSAPMGSFGSPVESKFGRHLVRVIKRTEGHLRSYEEAFGELRLAYLVERKRKVTEDLITRAFANYRVDVDGVRVTQLTFSGRTASDRPKLSD
jgi:peptidyl-prolyl cis-trans isomerase C